MSLYQNKEKTDAQNKRYREWGQLLNNIDQMYKNDLNDQNIKTNIRKQIFRGLLDEHSHRHSQVNQDNIQKDKQEEKKMMDSWKVQNQRKDRQEQDRRKRIREASLFNKNCTQNAMYRDVENMQKSMKHPLGEGDNQQIRLDRIYENQVEKKKAREEELKKVYESQQMIKIQKRSVERQKQQLEQYKKEQERAIIQQNRQREFQRVRQQHQQNMHVFKTTENILNSKKQQYRELIEHIAIDGALEKQRNIMDQYKTSILNEQKKRQQHAIELKQQLKMNQMRNELKQMTEKTYDKYIVDTSIGLFDQLENQRRRQNALERQRVVNILLEQQKEKKQRQLYSKTMDKSQMIIHSKELNPNNSHIFEHNSPLHLGQYTYEDRKRQMNQIDRNLYDNLVKLNAERMSQSMQMQTLQKAHSRAQSRVDVNPSPNDANPEHLQSARSARSNKSNKSKISEGMFKYLGNNILTGSQVIS